MSWRSGAPRRSWEGAPLRLPTKLNVGGDGRRRYWEMLLLACLYSQ